jgi:hypothetical protein
MFGKRGYNFVVFFVSPTWNSWDDITLILDVFTHMELMG